MMRMFDGLACLSLYSVRKTPTPNLRTSPSFKRGVAESFKGATDFVHHGALSIFIICQCVSLDPMV